MSSHIHNTRGMAVLGWLLLAVSAVAQVKIGDDLSMSLNGTVGTGYNGSYGNTQLSDHSSAVNGDANLTGFFYNPNFLNFYVRPIYNRAQDNSGAQSLTNTTNISTGAGIFTGSHFPGSITYGKSFNSTGMFGLPGVEGFTTHGNSTQFGIGWSELLPDKPTLSAQYFQTSSSSSLFGSDQEQHSNSRNFNLRSNYNIDGWMMNARFNDVYTRSELPSFVTAGEFNSGDINSKTVSFNTNHKLPLRGAFSFNYAYSDFHGDGNGIDTTGSDNTFTTNASFIPWSRLTTTVGAEYDTSLSGMVEQQLINSGGIAPQVNFGAHSNSLSFYNFDTISIVRGLNGSFSFNHTQQEAYGRTFSVNHFSGILNYHFQKPLWGSFTFYGGVNDQSTDTGHQGTGLVAGANFDKRIGGIDWGAAFNYSQDVQTVLATELTSSYSYLANEKKRFGRHWMWINNFHGFHTGLSQIAGSSSHSEGFGTNLNYRNYALGATYSQSYGTALLTANGLVPTPVTITPVLSGNQYLLVNGASYAVTASANPVRRWTVSASYTRALNDTKTPTLYSNNSAKAFTAFTQVQFRKVSFGGGYTHLSQGIGLTPGGLPADFSSFYVGIQRWFHPF